MNALAIAVIIFACTFAAAVIGMVLHNRLPEHHLDSESKDFLKLVMGLIGTMSALVLGLLIASAQSSYNSQNQSLQNVAADIVQLDRMLALYGPETKEVRDLVREAVRTLHDRIWSADGVRMEKLDPRAIREQADRIVADLQGLKPGNDAQQFLKAQAQQLAATIGRLRALMFEQTRGSIAWPFLVILVFWICVLFAGFGLLVRFHATTAIGALIGSISVSAAIFLILELGSPYTGLIQISDLPLRDALSQIGQGTP